MSNATAVVLNISGAEGYDAETVRDRSITLADLAQALEQAIDTFGAEARIVLHDSNNQYGAAYGVISQWVDVFEPVVLEDEDSDALGYGD